MKRTSKKYKKTRVGSKELAPETQMMHYGYDPAFSEGAVKCPNFQTSTFVFPSASQGKDFFGYASGQTAPAESNDSQGLVYSRFNNPTLEILEDRIGIWDGAEACAVTCTGMSAISTSLLALTSPGEVVVYSEPIYGGTDTLLRKVLSQFGIRSVGFIGNKGPEGLRKAVDRASKIGRVAAMMIETPNNPNSGLIDLGECARLASELNNPQGDRPLVLVDNTVCGPVYQKPLSLGADVCLYSLTKYIGGHSDLIGGSASGSETVIGKIRRLRNILGTTMDPNTAWLVLRSLETLDIRMKRASRNSLEVAEFLRNHPKVRRVRHLGLLEPDDPDYALFKKQCAGFGSTFSFEIEGGEASAFHLLDSLEIIQLAVSLGGTETLIQHPAAMTHSGVSDARRKEIGITDGLIRISVGIEHPDDLIADLEQALSKI